MCVFVSLKEKKRGKKALFRTNIPFFTLFNISHTKIGFYTYLKRKKKRKRDLDTVELKVYLKLSS